MRAEFLSEVPQGVSRDKYGMYLKKLYSGEEKCVVFTFDTHKEVDSACSAIRYHLKRHNDNGTFCMNKNSETKQIYVYKV